jgi:hypothetical protein
MPNHTTNNLEFNGSPEEVKILMDSISSTVANKDGTHTENLIDFERIIPRPKELNIESGTMADNGLAILLFREKGDDSMLRQMLNYAWVKIEGIGTVEALVEHLLNKGTTSLSMGKQALDNLNNYGHKDWYSWSIDKWGTKCNAYSQHKVSDNEITFQTAWSAPIPVIIELSKQFPTVEIKLSFSDEEFGYGCGELALLAGQVTEENIPKAGSDEAFLFSKNTHGMNEVDMINYYGDAQDEEFVQQILRVLTNDHSPSEIANAVVAGEYTSIEMLEAVKGMLLEQEAYECIDMVDEKLKNLIEQ